MTKLDAGLITSLPASDSGSASAWTSKRINPRPQSCLCLTWSGYPLNNDDDDNIIINCVTFFLVLMKTFERPKSFSFFLNKILLVYMIKFWLLIAFLYTSILKITFHPES